MPKICVYSEHCQTRNNCDMETVRWILGVLLLLVTVAFASGIQQKVEVQSNNFREVGYFKAANKDRIISVEMIGSVTAAEAKAYAKRKMNTPGRMTAVYFYAPGSVILADGLTLANNLYAANTVLYDMPGLSKRRYAYMNYGNGKEELGF